MFDFIKMEMTLEQRKNKLAAAINDADSDLLERLEETVKVFRKKGKHAIVAYSVDGEPLSLAQYKSEIENAVAEIENGDYITHEDLRREVGKWSK